MQEGYSCISLRMAHNDKHLRYEEDYFFNTRKESRMERKIAQAKDRSKYKKTNQKEKKSAPSTNLHLKRGLVIAILPNGFLVSLDNTKLLCALKGSLKKERTKHTNLVAVGDFVRVHVKEQGLGSIVYVEERFSFLSRADNISRRKQQLIAVNLDQVFIVISVISPKLKPTLVDRYIIAAFKGNMTPIILINKLDLLKNPPQQIEPEFVEKEQALLEEFTKGYENIHIPVLKVSVETGDGIDLLKSYMKDCTSVFSGQSGVGKSSILNTITGTKLKVGNVIAKTHKGSHTTSAAHLIPLDCGGFCIDTPGIKSFGLFDLQTEELNQFFPEFDQYSHECKFPNCTHLHEPSCAVRKATEIGALSELRYESYRTIYNNPILKEWE